MPNWLVNLVLSLGLPPLKLLLMVVLRALERKVPGIQVLVDALIAYLRGNSSAASSLHEHLASTVPNFPACPVGQKCA